ncbi:hypothetical protein OOU_Y34scaffold00174g22 [Pyricularia oryzae Y34]|uniref:Uncharacterized protein n=2 Tax=Pyricularia oryzae TaxID=318829 RepID=A0AA97PQD2_PYRO3|nr:hypothetical protein OOU_Y34scaffold00174g22 [Pyricularia oryzae Y34]
MQRKKKQRKRVGDLGTRSPAACAAIQFTPGIIDNARHGQEKKPCPQQGKFQIACKTRDEPPKRRLIGPNTHKYNGSERLSVTCCAPSLAAPYGVPFCFFFDSIKRKYKVEKLRTVGEKLQLAQRRASAGSKDSGCRDYKPTLPSFIPSPDQIWQGPEMLRRYPTTHPKVAVSPVFHLWQANEDFISVWAEVCGKTQLLVLQCGKSCPSNIYGSWSVCSWKGTA